MSKRINVNPDHYKVAGRERQGENVVHSVEKRALAKLRRDERQIAPVRPAAPPTKKAPVLTAPPPTKKAPVLTAPPTKKGKGSSAPVKATRQGHTSHKAGGRSIARKEAKAAAAKARKKR